MFIRTRRIHPELQPTEMLVNTAMIIAALPAHGGERTTVWLVDATAAAAIIDEPFEKIARLLSTDPAPEGPSLDDRELAAVLAGLRSLQQDLVNLGTVDDDLADIASDGGRLLPLGQREIDALCERLNSTRTVA